LTIKNACIINFRYFFTSFPPTAKEYFFFLIVPELIFNIRNDYNRVLSKMIGYYKMYSLVPETNFTLKFAKKRLKRLSISKIK